MGIFGVLTVIFIVLKVLGIIAWSWWAVFSPMFILIGLYAIWLVFVGLLTKLW